METRRAGEVRALSGSRIEGVVMRYGALGTIPGGRRERFMPGAFGSVPDAIDLTLQHDPASVVGRVALTDSATELRAAGEVTPAVHELVRRRALTGFSVEMMVSGERTVPDFGASVREVHGASLEGLSVVDEAAYPASGIEARRKAGRLRTTIPTGRRMDCRCSGKVTREKTVTLKRIQFDPGAFRLVEEELARRAREIHAIGRGAGDVVATAGTGSLRLTVANGGALRIGITPLATEAGRRVSELVAAGVAVFARPVIDFDLSEYEIDGDTAVIQSADFRYVLVKPTDRTEGLDALVYGRTTTEGRGLSMRRRRLLLA